MEHPSQSLRNRWLETLLPMADTRGWGSDVVTEAAQAAGLSEGEQALAAPGGVNELIDHMFNRAADAMLVAIASRDLSEMRVHERVAAGVKGWLVELEPHREAVRKAAMRGVLPTSASAAGQTVWSIADAVWEAAGDTATDYNRQTKRGLLSAVIPSVVLFWADHPSEEKLDAHIEKRLDQAMRLGKAGSKIVKPVLDLFERV